VTDPTIEPDESLWVALDVGGTESATACVWVTEDLRVGCSIWSGDEGILRAAEKVRELRQTHPVVEFIFDPWRARQAALELEAEGVRCVELPQTDVRMCPASAGLRAAITERRIELPNHPDLARHAANAVAQHSRRGWRIGSPARGVQVDGIVALAMAVERAEHRPAPAQLLGFL
jgi:phage terminase large subunit-like protein